MQKKAQIALIINYMHQHLIIHFSEVVDKAVVKIFTEDNRQIDSFNVENEDFIYYHLPLEKGSYQVKITKQHIESIKSIIVN